MPLSLHLHRPTPLPANDRLRDNRDSNVGPYQDVDVTMNTSMEAHRGSPAPIRRTEHPIATGHPPNHKTVAQQLQDRPQRKSVNPIMNIPRHPSYTIERREGQEDNRFKPHGYHDDSNNRLRNIPKRPMSACSNEDLTVVKRKRTETGTQLVQANGGKPGVTPINRPLSREEVRYQAVAREHEEDARFLEDERTSENMGTTISRTPILVDDDVELPPRRLGRSLSRAEIAVDEQLTTAIRGLMSPIPRDRSPDRGRWRTASPLSQNQQIDSHPRSIASHIRTVNQIQVQFLPPGGNALGARSPEHRNGPPPRPLEHSPPTGLLDIRRTDHPMLAIPTSASEMSVIMTAHDQSNAARPVEARDFYIHKRTTIIAQGNEWARPCGDGTIRLSRYFELSQEEVDGSKEYLRHITGQETLLPKTMIRLTCRARNGPNGALKHQHAWPENTMVFLNGKCLLTSMVFELVRVG